MPLESVDISAHQFQPSCELCPRPATVIAQGCMDKHPVLMCDECLDRGIELIKEVVHYYQRFNKRVMICGDCQRPILRLDTHLEVKRLTRTEQPVHVEAMKLEAADECLESS